MAIKLIALDVDGTLINKTRHVSRENKKAIDKAREKGIIVTLVTGRHFKEVSFLCRELNIDHHIVCCNGAHVCTGISGQLLSKDVVPKDIVLPITESIEDSSDFFIHYLEDTVLVQKDFKKKLQYMKVDKIRSLKDLIGLKNWFKELNYIKPKLVPRAYDYIKESAEDLLVFTIKSNENIFKELQKTYGEEVDLVYVTSDFFDITPKGINKYTGLEKIMELYNIKETEVMAIGDHLNDLEMIKHAGIGVAMGNSPTPVKEVATWVTTTNDEDGVALAFRKANIINEQISS